VLLMLISSFLDSQSFLPNFSPQVLILIQKKQANKIVQLDKRMGCK
jgi:hypothetical protein